MKKATIEEVKKAKVSLELMILQEIQEFEKDYGVRLTYISINRENDAKACEAPSRPDAPKYHKPMNVDINMDLDLIDY